MKKRWIVLIALVGLAGIGLLAGSALSQPEEDETPVTYKDLPEAVAATYDKFAAAGTVTDYVREFEGGAVDYTAIVEIGGGAFELELAEDGSVREVEALVVEDEASDDDDADDDADDAEDEDEAGDVDDVDDDDDAGDDDDGAGDDD